MRLILAGMSSAARVGLAEVVELALDASARASSSSCRASADDWRHCSSSHVRVSFERFDRLARVELCEALLRVESGQCQDSAARIGQAIRPMVMAKPTAGGHVHGAPAISQPTKAPRMAPRKKPPMAPLRPASAREQQREQHDPDDDAAQQRDDSRRAERLNQAPDAAPAAAL